MAAARSPFIVIEGDKNLKVTPPAIVMLQPKFLINVATMIRNCAAFGVEWLILTGDRIDIPTGNKGDRLPRQERMREYRTVKVVQAEIPMVLFKDDVVPVGVELTPTSMPLQYFDHPENAVYLLGPEDGSISKGYRAICHHIVQIPTFHCLNVSTAGAIILYDRMQYRYNSGLDPLPLLNENRG